VETPSAELCSCRRDKHVVAFCRTKICPTRNVGDYDADVVEVGRTVLTDTVERRDCYLELYSLWHWQPVKHVAKSRRDVFIYYNTVLAKCFQTLMWCNLLYYDRFFHNRMSTRT